MSLDDKTIPRPDIGKAKNLKNIRWDFWGLTILYIVALLINGLNEFVAAGFDPTVLFTPEWYYDLFRTLSVNLMVLYGTIFYLISKLKRTDERILKREKEIERNVNKYLNPITFDIFLPSFNRQRKIEAYKKMMSDKIDKLEKKYNDKQESLILWSRYLKDELTEEDKERFEIDKFCQKKLVLTKQLEEEYIEDVIDHLDIDYKPVTKKFVKSGSENADSKYDDYHVESGKKKLLYETIPKVFLTIVYLAAYNTIVIDLFTRDSFLISFIMFLLGSIPLIIQIILAKSYSDNYIEDKVLVDLGIRKDVMLKYIGYLKDNEEEVIQNGGE